MKGRFPKAAQEPEKVGNAVYTGKMMDLQELELIDINDSNDVNIAAEEEQLVRKAKKRKEHRPEKERQKKREIEAWPMGEWASRGSSVRKMGEAKAEERQSPRQIYEKKELKIKGWETENLEEEEWEEEPEEEEWEEDWEEEPEEEEWEVRKRPSKKSKKAIKHRPQKYLSAEETDVQEKKRRRKKRRRRTGIIRGVMMGFSITVVLGALSGAGCLAIYVYKELAGKEDVQTISQTVEEAPNQDIREWAKFYATELERPALSVDLLTVNEYSRPGEALPEVKSIFVHYTANAGTTAEQNRSYFESLAESHERSASAHFVIGYDGTIVQCIPTKEIAYAVKGRNYDSISIECCYLNENGKFEEETYRTLIELTAWLLHKYELRPENVLRHYDEGGKNCPKYYVEHESAWEDFLNDLRDYMTSVTEE